MRHSAKNIIYSAIYCVLAVGLTGCGGAGDVSTPSGQQQSDNSNANSGSNSDTSDSGNSQFIATQQAVSEFQLFDNRTYGTYKDVDLTELKNGDFIAVMAASQFGSSAGSAYIAMQRFGPTGAAKAQETVIDSLSNDSRSSLFDEVEVVSLSDDRFAVVWVADGPNNIRGQIFNSEGIAQTQIFEITASYNSSGSDLDVVASGERVFIAYTNNDNVFVQTFDESGEITSPLTLGSLNPGDLENRYPSVSVTNDNRVRVTFEKVNNYRVINDDPDNGRFEYNQDLYFVTVSADGRSSNEATKVLENLSGFATTELFLIDPFLGITQTVIRDFNSDHDHTTLADGRLAVAYRPDASNTAVYLQLFNADGSTISQPVLVHDSATTDAPKIIQLAGGEIAIAWRVNTNQSVDGNGFDVMARYFTEIPTPKSDAFTVNQITTSDQDLTSISATANGGLLASYISDAYLGDSTRTDNGAVAGIVLAFPQ